VSLVVSSLLCTVLFSSLLIVSMFSHWTSTYCIDSLLWYYYTLHGYRCCWNCCARSPHYMSSYSQ